MRNAGKIKNTQKMTNIGKMKNTKNEKHTKSGIYTRMKSATNTISRVCLLQTKQTREIVLLAMGTFYNET